MSQPAAPVAPLLPLDLRPLQRCFQGILPSMITTCAKDGVPNTSAVSHAHMVDETHVALSCQFFNKTRRNLDENPQAELEIIDPLDLEGYYLDLDYVRSETSGPLFEALALRLDAIAALSGMQGVFKLRSADVFAVRAIERSPNILRAASESEAPLEPKDLGPYAQLRALQILAQRINRARTLEQLFASVFDALAETFGFSHAMILVPDGSDQRLVTVASHGYGESGVGAEVAIGEGLIGTVAAQRKAARIGNVTYERIYHQRLREEARGHSVDLRPEIALPGLPDAASQAALPLLAGEDLVGVLLLESSDLLAFEQWAEPLFDILGYQVALGIDRLSAEESDEADLGQTKAAAAAPPSAPARRHTFTLFRSDDCVFVDGEYLVRNVPGLVLWKLLSAHQASGQSQFSNRELRLDPALKLPPLRDNLESRLILLRKRLESNCPDVRLVPVRRGRFALELDAPFELIEKP